MNKRLSVYKRIFRAIGSLAILGVVALVDCEELSAVIWNYNCVFDSNIV